MDHAQEREWVRLARGGDRDAFARLIDRYWDRLRRWLYGLTGQMQWAEDLTQDAFLKAWTALPSLKEDQTFRVWLFRIARNGFLDSRRGPRGQAPDRLPEELSAKGPGPLAQLEHDEAMAKLQAALARLPASYRAAYLLWTQEELPYARIAKVLGIRAETARWRVCKARRFLYKLLQPYLGRTSR